MFYLSIHPSATQHFEGSSNRWNEPGAFFFDICLHKHTHRHTHVTSLQEVFPYAHMHVQTHAKYFQNIIQMLHIEIHCACIHSPADTLTHCVAVVCFIRRACEELSYWGTDGTTLELWVQRPRPFHLQSCSSSLPLPFVWGDACHKFLPCMSETPVAL